MGRSAGNRVLVVGDANPDLVLRGDVVPRFGQTEQLLDDAALLLGGSAAITAHAFARLGRPVSLLAATGRDAFGDTQRRELDAAGVDTDLMPVRDDVATGVTVVLSAGDDRGILTYPGAIPTLTAAEIHHAIEARPDVCHVHVASLFLQPQLVDVLPEVLRAVRSSGRTISLDTNDDPAGLWRNVSPLLEVVDVLLPNSREATALAGTGGDDPVSAARVLARQGPLVVVKAGPEGAYAVQPDGEVTTTAGPSAAVVDTTGAGDTFDAAFVDAWLDGAGIPAALHRGAQAGALAVQSVGGTAGQPRRGDLDPAPLPAERA
jgi:sugar/nucleoside kinase (ribokinase family)